MPTDPPHSGLTPEALRWLVCPVCRQSLVLDESTVRCSACNRHYPILDGIPVLLAERAS